MKKLLTECGFGETYAEVFECQFDFELRAGGLLVAAAHFDIINGSPCITKVALFDKSGDEVSFADLSYKDQRDLLNEYSKNTNRHYDFYKYDMIELTQQLNREARDA